MFSLKKIEFFFWIKIFDIMVINYKCLLKIVLFVFFMGFVYLFIYDDK